jgi:hypothetical protein
MSPQNPVERAFELARSGRVQTLIDLARALKAEGYGNVDAHLAGSGIRKQLRDILAEGAAKLSPAPANLKVHPD